MNSTQASVNAHSLIRFIGMYEERKRESPDFPSLESFDPRALKSIENMLTDADELDAVRIKREIKDVFDIMGDTGAHDAFNNLSVFGPDIFNYSYDSPWLYINGLEDYKNFRPEISDWLCDASDYEREIAKAIILVMLGLGIDHPLVIDGLGDDHAPHPDDDGYYSLDERVVQIILDHPFKIQEAIDVLKKNPEIDPATAVQMINFDNPVLRDGAL